MPIAQTNTGDIFYTVGGTGRQAVLLLHGAGGSHLLWPAALRRLPDATVYALDLPGHGRSPGPGRDSVPAYAAAVLAFMDAMGVKQAVLVGHSMGGAIAQTVALDAPQRVRALALISTGARLRVAPAILQGLQSSPAETVALITKWAWSGNADAALVAQGQQAMLDTPPAVLYDDFDACNRFDLRQRLGEIAVPALVLSGTDDRMTTPRLCAKLAEALPAGRLVSITGAGHMLMLEQPHQTGEAIAAFLRQMT